MSVKETVISNCEKKFVLSSLADFRRIDGRSFDEFRDLKIEFGKDWGSCHVLLGQTRVLAQVSCEIQTPKSTRPNEGILYVNLELNPLGAPHFEAGRQSDLSVQLNRHLEKCIKDSKAVDLESLCIKSREKVWALRADVNVLSHEGNIIDCASIATLSALAHFRRPDVTCDGEEVIVHTYAQRDSIPTVLHHYPVCISFAIFNDGEAILADPTLLEEGVSEANLMVSLNAYKELCGFHLGGSAPMSTDLIMKIMNKAANRAKYVIDLIKNKVQEDFAKRETDTIGFENCLDFIDVFPENPSKVLMECLDKWSVQNKRKKTKEENNKNNDIKVKKEKPGRIEILSEKSAVLLPPESSTNPWHAISDEDSDGDIQEIKPFIECVKIEDSGSSEEEKVVVLNANEKTKKKRRKEAT